MNRYQIYGYTLESEIPFPELASLPEENFSNGNKISFRIGISKPSGFLQKSIRLNGLRYHLPNGNHTAEIVSPLAGRFRVFLRRNLIEWIPSKQRNEDLARVILKGKALGFLLSHAPSLFLLHANVVVYEKQAVGFCGNIGNGKSTLTAHLVKNGLSLLSDDVAVLRMEGNYFRVYPGAPEIRLWPKSFRELKIKEIEGESLYPQTLKRRFFLNGNGSWSFTSKPSNLRTLYFLSRQSKGGSIRVENLKGHEAVMELLKNLYIPVLQEPRILKRQLAWADRLASKISLKRLFYPTGFQYLPRVRETILKELRQNA